VLRVVRFADLAWDTPSGILRAGFHDPVNLCLSFGGKVFAEKKLFAITPIPAWRLMPKS